MRNLNPLELAEEVEQDSQSGQLAFELLAKGQTLYSPDTYSNAKLSRVLPSGKVEEGYLINGEFVSEFSIVASFYDKI